MCLRGRLAAPSPYVNKEKSAGVLSSLALPRRNYEWSSRLSPQGSVSRRPGAFPQLTLLLGLVRCTSRAYIKGRSRNRWLHAMLGEIAAEGGFGRPPGD